jgi:hypothetical protein
MSNAFSTINAALSLHERHPDAPPSVRHVGLAMATFANGKTGTSIRPGVARLVSLTGLHSDTVQDAVEWLVERGELRRDKRGHRRSAACFTWIGGMRGSDTPAIDGMQGSHTANAGVSHPHHLPNQHPSGLEGPRRGKRCGKHPDVELYKGECWACERDEYNAAHGIVA